MRAIVVYISIALMMNRVFLWRIFIQISYLNLRKTWKYDKSLDRCVKGINGYVNLLCKRIRIGCHTIELRMSKININI
jgi:hypothetical protein